jgi:RecB family endonuclease NucS
MALFNINEKGKLGLIKETDFKLERDIQKLIEDNIKLVFGLDYVRSEFSINNFRIDTLSFDKDQRSFVIIEYKREKKLPRY